MTTPTAARCPVCAAQFTPVRQQRYLADKWCHDCNRPCRLLGYGGLCPYCDEPISAGELLSQHQ